MSYMSNFYEFGDFMIEFDNRYLGCGKTTLTMESAWRDIRRDALLPPQQKLVKALNITITSCLKSGNRVWELLSDDEKRFSIGGIDGKGAVLKLYPADPGRRGFAFQRVFIRKIEDVSGNNQSSGQFKLEFTGESDPVNGAYFTRLEPGSRPAELPARSVVDMKALMQKLIVLLAPRLGAVADHSINIDSFAPVPEGSYSLSLEKCKDLCNEQFHSFEFKLTARFLREKKFYADQKLYDCAQFLNDYRIDLGSAVIACCRINELDFSGQKNISGNSVSDSFIKFTLILE